ncbi:MAG: hypothetical protein Kapaf2KO_10600 [Candidatus Kapaibacteriales bacterium]
MAEDYYKTKESVEEYTKLAQDVSGEELINHLKEYLPQNSSLLEVGSGPGTDWNILAKYYNVTGSDNSEEFLKLLITKNPNGSFLNLDAITISTIEKFDGIYSNKVLHHLQNDELEASIKRQYEILNKNGIICHSFWKGEGSEVFKGLFVNYHLEQELRNYFEQYFEILLLKSYAEFEDGDSLLLIGKKK